MRVGVLQLLDGAEGGGPGSHALHLTAALPDAFDSRVACLRDGSLTRRLRELGHQPPTLDKRFRLDLRLLPRLLRLIDEQGITILHSHTYGCNFYARLAGRLRPALRVVTTYHSSILDEFAGDERDGAWNRAIYRGELWMTRWSHRLIAVSDQVRRRMEEGGVPPGRIEVIANGIAEPAPPVTDAERRELRRQRGMEPDAPVIGAVSRLVPLKALDVLVDALPEVVRQVPAATLRIVGDGRSRAALEVRARVRGVRDRVSFVGWSWEASQEMRTFDVLAFPSVLESQGLVPLEAMACGLPVVASDIPGPRETVVDGETGLLVPPRNAAALAEALVRLLSSRDEAERMGRSGWDRVSSRFSRRTMGERVARTYRAALERPWVGATATEGS